MSSFYEQELQKLFADGKIISEPKFVGRSCTGKLDADLRVRVQFVTSGFADHYDAISVTVLNRTDGVVDRLRIRLRDVLGKKQVQGNPNFPNGVSPHIWEDSGNAEWYAFRPSSADYTAIRQAVGEYLDVFREQIIEREHGSPKLIYICAPLRGEVEKNIAFAQEKAREVFESGDIPICPHLLFPPIADPADPTQDQAAREMGLRLVESCQQVNVYGPVWTDGMWAEIRHAEKLGIPIMTDQKELGRTICIGCITSPYRISCRPQRGSLRRGSSGRNWLTHAEIVKLRHFCSWRIRWKCSSAIGWMR